MSDTDDDIYAWANSPNANDNDDDDHQGGVISGGFDAGGAGRRTSSSRRRSSNRGGARTTPRYKDESSSEEEEEEEEEVEEVEEEEEEEENNVGGKERSSRRGTASSVSSSAGSKRNSPKTSEEGPAVVVSSGAVESEIDNDRSDGDERNEGIDVVIPYALLNKDRGAGRGECTVLVQVEPGGGDGNDGASSDRLDFHGQSGAVGRFEADGEGVILDFKGYQHRGTIRPGPTAMVVALTRDGQLKVEAITDEFVSLDADAGTDVMARLDAVVGGEMDETYRYRGEEDVNKNPRKGREGEEGEEDGKRGGRKRAGSSRGGAAPKRRRTAARK